MVCSTVQIGKPKHFLRYKMEASGGLAENISLVEVLHRAELFNVSFKCTPK